jgi:hypothetical protein
VSFDHPIQTLEQARAYFEAMHCSLFHIHREDSARSSEFSALHISEQTLEEWMHDYSDKSLSTLTTGICPRDELWSLHVNLADVVCSLSSPALVERFYEATCLIQCRLTQFDKLLVAETLVGRSANQNKSGLIFRSQQMNRPDLAQKFAELVRTLTSEAFSSAEVSPFGREPIENRRLILLANLEAVLQSCKKRIWNLPWALLPEAMRKQ